MRVQCCVCGKTRKGVDWVQSQDADKGQDRVSHGYCPKCAAKAFRQISKRQRQTTILNTPLA